MAFTTADGRVAASAEVDAQLARWTRQRDAVDVMQACQAAGVPAGVVQNSIDLVEHDPQLRESRFQVDLDEVDPVLGPLMADRLPIEFEGTPCETYRPAQPIGADNRDVLNDWLGLSADDVREGEDNGYLT